MSNEEILWLPEDNNTLWISLVFLILFVLLPAYLIAIISSSERTQQKKRSAPEGQIGATIPSIHLEKSISPL